MGFFEKYLSIWVTLSIALGTLLGYLLPGLFDFIATLEYQKVNLVIALFIWIMIFLSNGYKHLTKLVGLNI